MAENESRGNAQSLEARLREVEDRLEIYNLIASHPPSADTAADYYTRVIFTEDGVFDRGESLDFTLGSEAIAAITLRPAHHEAIHGGLAHFAGLPHVELDGDSAWVTSYLQLIHPDAEGAERELPNHGVSTGYRIHRVLANRWELTRTPGGWKIKSRKLRPLDGSAPARDILAHALTRHRPAD